MRLKSYSLTEDWRCSMLSKGSASRLPPTSPVTHSEGFGHASKRSDLCKETKGSYVKAFNELISCRDLAAYSSAHSCIVEDFVLCADHTKSWVVHGKHFVGCFTSSNFSLGIRTTQGVESIHKSVKRFLDHTSVPLQTRAGAF